MSWLVRSGWLAAAGVAAVGPVLLGWAIEEPEPPVPEQVKAYWVDGALTMVEVTDFDCPHCRRAEPLIGAFRREHPELRFVRLAAPMPAHAHARPAARAFLAAQAQGAGEDMAALLLTAENRDAAHCREYAARLRMDLDKFDRVVGAPATDAELDATVEWARAAGTGLPMVWIQGKRIQGVPTYDALTFALERARKE
jgi:protein-disulfide isomerase